MADLSDKIIQSAKNAGAESKADVGVFLAGAAAGGLVDATLNTFGFAEPMVVAPLTGAAALAAKRLLWDPLFVKREPSGKVESEDTYKDLRLEIKALKSFGHSEDALALKKFVDECEADGVSASKCKDLYERAKQYTENKSNT